MSTASAGEPLPGFSQEDCIPIVVDAVNATVFWAKDWQVTLMFRMRNNG